MSKPETDIAFLIAEARELAAKATQAPWSFNGSGGYVCFMQITDGRPTNYVSAPQAPGMSPSVPDAAFITFARNNILALADECERLQRKFDKEAVAAAMFRTQSKAERDALSAELDHIKNLHRIASAAAAFQQSENAKLRAEIAHIKKFGYFLDETPREELSTLRSENFSLSKAAATLACVEDYSDEEGRISQVWYELARDAIAALPPRKESG